MNELKSQQRRNAYQARNGQADKDARSRIICARFIRHPAYQAAKSVMWYSHCRSEVRTQEALLLQLATDKCIVVPYCAKDERGHNKLGLWRLEDIAELRPGTWGILEPPRQRWGELGKEIDPERLDCIMAPGVAFDRNGGRLGNGAGYYDHLLKSVRAATVLIGVCFESQLVEQVVIEAHDVAMDFVITEKTIYAGKGRRLSN